MERLNSLVIEQSASKKIIALITEAVESYASDKKEELDIAKREIVQQIPRFRIRIATGGCSGFRYEFVIDSEYDADADVLLKLNPELSTDLSCEVVIDKVSRGFIAEGATLVYLNEIDKSGFELSNNSSVTSKCGCGLSFDLLSSS